MIPKLIRSMAASAAVAPYRIVAFSDAANSSDVATAAAATDPMIGTSGKVGADAGDLLDVTLSGLGEVTLGGAVGAGDPLTSDDEGRAILADEDGQRIVGFAFAPGVENDVAPYLCAPGVLSVPAEA